VDDDEDDDRRQGMAWREEAFAPLPTCLEIMEDEQATQGCDTIRKMQWQGVYEPAYGVSVMAVRSKLVAAIAKLERRKTNNDAIDCKAFQTKSSNVSKLLDDNSIQAF